MFGREWGKVGIVLVSRVVNSCYDTTSSDCGFKSSQSSRWLLFLIVK